MIRSAKFKSNFCHYLLFLCLLTPFITGGTDYIEISEIESWENVCVLLVHVQGVNQIDSEAGGDLIKAMPLALVAGDFDITESKSIYIARVTNPFGAAATDQVTAGDFAIVMMHLLYDPFQQNDTEVKYGVETANIDSFPGNKPLVRVDGFDELTEILHDLRKELLLPLEK